MGCDAEINLAVSHKASQRAEDCVCVCVCGGGDIYTLDSHHVERMCSVKICKLNSQSDQSER